MVVRRFTSSGVANSSALSSSSSSTSSSVETRISQKNQQQQKSDLKVDNQRHLYGSSSFSNNNSSGAVAWTKSATSQHSNNKFLREINIQTMQRIQALELENRRIMGNQGKLISESNRRLDMHLNEIRLLKEEVKTLKTANQELRVEKQRTQQLCEEWKSFGRYVNQLMKKEINVYQTRVIALDANNKTILAENTELKRLCLYLDEQRQTILNSMDRNFLQQPNVNQRYLKGVEEEFDDLGEAELSEDAGCGSSAVSSSSSDLEHIHSMQPAKEDNGIMTNSIMCISQNQEKEKALRSIADQMSTSSCTEEKKDVEKTFTISTQAGRNKRVLDYIQSLENRIRQLEQCESRSFQPATTSSAFNFPFNSLKRECRSESLPSSTHSVEEMPPNLSVEEISLVQHSLFSRLLPKLPIASDQSSKLPIQVLSNVIAKTPLFRREPAKSSESPVTMTSSGANYCISEADENGTAPTTILVGDESFDTALFDHLEVRSLGTIPEEEDNSERIVELEETLPNDQSECAVETSVLDPFFKTRRIFKEDQQLEEDGCSSRDGHTIDGGNNNRISSSSIFSASSSNFSSSSNRSFEDREGRRGDRVDCLDMDLPPRMPLLSETNRFSVCSTSDLSLDNFSICSDCPSRESVKANTKALTHASLQKPYNSPILERRTIASGQQKQQVNCLSRMAPARIGHLVIQPDFQAFQWETGRVANTTPIGETVYQTVCNSLEQQSQKAIERLKEPAKDDNDEATKAKRNNIVDEGRLIQAHFTSV